MISRNCGQMNEKGRVFFLEFPPLVLFWTVRWQVLSHVDGRDGRLCYFVLFCFVFFVLFCFVFLVMFCFVLFCFVLFSFV